MVNMTQAQVARGLARDESRRFVAEIRPIVQATRTGHSSISATIWNLVR